MGVRTIGVHHIRTGIGKHAQINTERITGTVTQHKTRLPFNKLQSKVLNIDPTNHILVQQNI